ncbi:MAG: hypothetical protein R2820_15215 [Cyclobacteriaceae bacterium]|nr:hypothetical protein [Cyclobacteriaceae bacterium]
MTTFTFAKNRSARILVLTLTLVSSYVFGQRQIDETIAVKSGQTLNMRFDYPELIRISTWDKNEISIKGTVTINFGANDDAFELDISNQGNVISVENHIKNMKSLPQIVTIVDNGKKMIFRTKEEYRKYKAENGSSYDVMSWGVDMDILLDIKIPKTMKTSVESVYGMVEIKDFSAPLSVVAKYGGVDAALNETMVGELNAETNYGQIYSNLDVKFGGEGLRERDFYTHVSAKPGRGPRFDFESEYGNVYLRKSN